MKRIKLTVAYDGTAYSGWQIQPLAPTIEQELDQAIAQVTGEQIHVTGASRTDAGVHAMGNVAVFDTEATIPGDRWAYAINRYLPADIVVKDSREVSPHFHPRHCNTVKTYEYVIDHERFADPKLRNYAWHVSGKLNMQAMQEAGQLLVGEHDFKSFCCVRTQAESTIRRIDSIEVESTFDGTVDMGSEKEMHQELIKIRVCGNGFLYNMVRIIAGTLIQVGKGQKQVQDVQEMLDAKNRCAAGQTAPPQGLTLMYIDYVDKEDAEYLGC